MATTKKAKKSEKQIALAMAKELEQTQREIAVFMTQAQTVPVWALPHVVHVKSGVCGIENEIIAVLLDNDAIAPAKAATSNLRSVVWASAMTANEIHAAIVKRFQSTSDGISKRYPLKTVKQYLSHTMRPKGYVASLEWKTPDELASLEHVTNTPCKWFLVSNSKQAKQGHK
jgi:hypothetical protein